MIARVTAVTALSLFLGGLLCLAVLAVIEGYWMQVLGGAVVGLLAGLLPPLVMRP